MGRVMAAEIHKLPYTEVVRSHVPVEPNQEIIEVLKGLLESAEAGHIRSLAYVALSREPEKRDETLVRFDYLTSPDTLLFSLIGGVGYLHWSMNNDVEHGI